MKKRKIKIVKTLFSFALFVTALFVWNLTTLYLKGEIKNPKFKTLYSITGNEEQAVEILKCSDIKSIECALHEECSAEFENKSFQQECFNDWVENEIASFEQKP